MSNLNESIINIRVKLQEKNLKKSGKNKFAGFDYFELSDFLPTLNKLMQEEKVNDLFVIEDNQATLTLIKGEERQTYKIPFVMFDTPLTFKKDKNGNFLKNKDGEYIQIPSMQDIQYLGALTTYNKRYLYMNAFGITDGEVIDAMDNEDVPEVKTKKTTKQVKSTKFKDELVLFCKENKIDLNTIAKEYKLNGNSTDEDFGKALENIINKNIENLGEVK